MAGREAPGVKTFQLKKKVGVGFGIALSGGAGQPPAQGQHDTGIYISDVVNAGPAQGKLQIGDKLIMVQGKSCMGMSRTEVVNMLRTAGQMVNLSVVRQSDVPASTLPRSQYTQQPQQSNKPPSNQQHSNGPPGQPANGHNHSYNSSNDKSTYFTDEEEDYMTQKQPLPTMNQSHHHHQQQQQHPPGAPSSHHHSQHPHNSTIDNRQPNATLEANSHRSYNTMGPDGTVTLDVNEPEATKIVMSKPPQSKERFGIQFGTQLVVRDVMPGSLADQKHANDLRQGDVIVAVNGQDVSNLDKNIAMQIAAKNRNRLELLVKKKSGMTVTVPISASNFDQLSDHMGIGAALEETTLQSRRPVEQASEAINMPEARKFDDPDTREVVFRKTSKSLGIRLEGGNNVGIFIANIQSGSPAEGQGLRVGDKILEVNGNNFRYTTHEEAIHTLMSIRQDQVVSIKVKHCPEAFDKCQETQVRDQFYIRTHFKFDGDRNEPQWNLTFNKGEVFLVYDTLYMGQLGNWQASRIDARNRQGTRGIIPNKSRADMVKKAQDARLEKLRLGHVNKVLQRFKTGNTVTKHPRSNGYSSGPKFDPYERVCLREASFRRPIVFFGPVADVARQLLVRESQLDFEPCQEVHNPNALPGRKGVVKIQSINEIISRDKHAVLDVTPNAVEKLNYAQLYPICIYLKSTDRNRVKQIRDRFDAPKKNPKKQIDRATKLDRSYRHVFTDVLDIDRCGRGREWTDELFRRIHDQQHLLVWVSERHETVDNAEEELDNEQDRFSYVSAPASDYSVTTVGTELAHEHDAHSEAEDDVEEHAKKAEIPKPKRRERTASPTPNEFQLEETVEDRPFGEEDLMPNGHAEQQQQRRPRVQDMATSPVHYPPPPPDETGPGRYTSQPRRKHQPPPVNRASQYDYPPVEQHQEPYQRNAPPPHNEEWPAPIDNSTMNRPYREETTHYQHHQQHNEYVAPEPAQYQPQQQQQQHYRHSSPPAPPKQPQEASTKPSSSSARFDPQAILARKQQQHGNLARVEQQQPPPQPQHQQPDHYQQQPSINTQRAPQHQTKPLTSSNNSNKPGGYYLNQTARPYQSSWNPHPKPTKVEIPSGTVKNRINQFGTNPSSVPNTVQRHEPPPQQQQQQPARQYSPPMPQPPRQVPEERQESPQPPAAPKKDVVATARGIFDYNGGVLSSLETGVSLVIPEGAIPYGTQQEIYFKVCQDENSLPTPANAAQGERLMSPMVMCGPHGLKFEVPIELRLPHRPERDPSESLNLTATQPDEESVSILIDHF